MSFLSHIEIANNAKLDKYLPYYWRDQPIGFIRRDRLELIKSLPAAFEIEKDRINLPASLDSYHARSAALSDAIERIADKGIITGWRGEKYPITSKFGATSLAEVERAAASFLGIRSWGVHINGYVYKADGIHMWVATRAKDKPTYPGMLDNMVAGGQPLGLSLHENVIKECAEEASIPESLAASAKPVSAIGYFHEWEPGLKPDQMFCYDLELPESFKPEAADGEVESFELIPIKEIYNLVRDTTKFKYNCNLCIIDFMIRHAILNPDNEPDYMDICMGLKRTHAL